MDMKFGYQKTLLFVLVTIMSCVFLSNFINPSNNLTAANNTGKKSFVFNSEKHIVYFGDRKIIRIIGSPTLNNIYVSAAVLQKIASIEKVKEIRIEYAYLEEEGLKHLVAMQDLEQVCLARTNLTDVGLNHVLNINKLNKLDVSFTNLSKKTFAGISNHKKLSVLVMTDMRYINPSDFFGFEETKKGLKIQVIR